MTDKEEARPMIKIRKVQIKDTASLHELLQGLIDEQPPVALELEALLMKGEQWIRTFPSGESGHFIVAEEDERIVGFCYLAVPKFYRPVAYIGVVVDKEHRRGGLGSRMFYHVAEWAAAEKLQYIISDVWSWNLKSLKFFEKLGFVEKTRFKDKFKGDYETKVRLVKEV